MRCGVRAYVETFDEDCGGWIGWAGNDAVAGPHRLKAGEDYEVDRARLPSGPIMLDEVRIDFAAPPDGGGGGRGRGRGRG